MIYVSGYGSADSMWTGIADTAQTFLRKPFERRELLAAVAARIGQVRSEIQS